MTEIDRSLLRGDILTELLKHNEEFLKASEYAVAALTVFGHDSPEYESAVKKVVETNMDTVSRIIAIMEVRK